MDIVWHSRRAAGDALRAHLGPDIAIGRHCPACGSDEHGRPWVRLPDGRTPYVSLARCAEHLVTVVADRPVGIDVESIAAVDARWDPALVLHPDELQPHLPGVVPTNAHVPGVVPKNAHVPGVVRDWAGTSAERAAMWCRKEAILKALGTGLRTPMSEIRCADWPVVDIPAPEGLTASVVVIAQAGSGGRSTE